MASLEKVFISAAFAFSWAINHSGLVCVVACTDRQRDKQLRSAQVQSPFSPSFTRLTIDVEEDEFPLCVVTHGRTGRYHVHKVFKVSCNIKDFLTYYILYYNLLVWMGSKRTGLKKYLNYYTQFFFMYNTLRSKYFREPDKQAYYMVTFHTGSCQILPVSCVLSHSAWMLSLM